MASAVPIFIPGHAGALFAMFYPPPAGEKSKHAILHIPAFAEEMNKSRHMVAIQAREFAKNGYSVLIFDLFGTGDSEGEFSDATWDIWKNDINTACQWLIKQGIEIINLWSLRSGALLAMDFIVDTKFKLDKLLCWQPVLNGETFVMQFLRLRVAALVMDKSLPTEKTTDLKQQLLDGNSVEVAGYALNPYLTNPLMNLVANKINLMNVEQIKIFELVNNSEKSISPGTNKFVDCLQQDGKSISLSVVIGSPFWSTQEIIEVPDLINQTINALN
jgi:exosortase A-associated hydrolase 2